MRIRGRLVTAFLACGLIPMLALSSLNLWNARRGSMEISKHASEDLRVKIEQQLTAARDLKQAEVQDYFKTIQDQVITFSSDVMIVDAMRGFNSAFSKYCEQREIDDKDVTSMRQHVSRYYEQSFAH